MTDLMSIDNVSVFFRVGEGRVVRAVDKVSLSIAAGETLALVGESGSGKSTLGYAIAGLRAPTAGSLRFEGSDLNTRTWPGARKKIQMVFQDPYSALNPRMTISSIIAEPLRIQRVGTTESRRQRAADLVTQVGLPRDSLNRYPHEFSGGQRQRIAIARALALSPRLIVADEPLSALDVSFQSQIVNMMKDLQAAMGLSYLFISHDLAVVNHLADRVAVLYLGHLVEIADRATLFKSPAHPYTQALLDSVPRIGRKRERGAGTIKGEIPSPLYPPSGCVFHTRCPKAQSLCREQSPSLDALPGRPWQHAACHFKE
ncbi:ATP-binding cassette domain-containing protein [Sinorhizobium meliloti]|nr:oligopeptide/dipeptide ABC transporter ATP-binding protein [Sinorhizobium meliloti]MQU72451.1 ATP-binding cassette domain-containing protein [Sinorhizobium meliloti]